MKRMKFGSIFTMFLGLVALMSGLAGCEDKITEGESGVSSVTSRVNTWGTGYFISVGFGSEIECQRHRHLFYKIDINMKRMKFGSIFTMFLGLVALMSGLAGCRLYKASGVSSVTSRVNTWGTGYFISVGFGSEIECQRQTDGLFVVNRPSVLEIMNYFIKLI